MTFDGRTMTVYSAAPAQTSIPLSASPTAQLVEQTREAARQMPVAASLSPPKLSREEIYEQIGSLICKVETSNGTATGFFINNLVVVPFHVLRAEAEDAHSYRICDILCFCDGNVYEATYLYEFPIDIVLSIDCAIFGVTDVDFPKRPPDLRIFDQPLKPGKKVYFGGFPLTQEDPTFHSGIISSVHNSTTSSEISYFTIDGVVVPGNSGGPVFVDDQGILKLAGIISHQIADFDPDARRTMEIFAAIKESNVEIMECDLPFHTREGDKSIKIGTLQTSALLFDLLQRNLSTGIGNAVQARDFLRLVNKEKVTSNPSLARAMPVKHGTLQIRKVSDEAMEMPVNNSLYGEIVSFFRDLLKSQTKKFEFYSKLDGSTGTIYAFNDWRLDRQAKPADQSANLQVQVKDKTVATILVSPRLLAYGNNAPKIAEVANYVAYHFIHAVKHCQNKKVAVVFRVDPK